MPSLPAAITLCKAIQWTGLDFLLVLACGLISMRLFSLMADIYVVLCSYSAVPAHVHFVLHVHKKMHYKNTNLKCLLFLGSFIYEI